MPGSHAKTKNNGIPRSFLAILVAGGALALAAAALVMLAYRSSARLEQLERPLAEKAAILAGAAVPYGIAHQMIELGEGKSAEIVLDGARRVGDSLAALEAIPLSEPTDLVVRNLRNSHEKLSADQRSAFELLQQGKADEAKAIVEADEYKAAMLRLEESARSLSSSADYQFREQASRERLYLQLALASALATLPFLFAAGATMRKACRDQHKEREAYEEKLKAHSVRDPITGFYNRHGFLSIAEQEWKLAARQKKPVTIFYADVNDLKTINHRHGHDEAERMVKEVSELLHQSFRDSDVIARLDGDEFAILMMDTDREKAQLVRERLERKTEQFRDSKPRQYPFGITVGAVTMVPNADVGVKDFLRSAKSRMADQEAEKKRAQKEEELASAGGR